MESTLKKKHARRSPLSKLSGHMTERSTASRPLISSRRMATCGLPTAAALAALLVACGNPAESIRPDPEPTGRIHLEVEVDPPATPSPSSTPATAPDIDLGPEAPAPPPKVTPPPKVRPIPPAPKHPQVKGDMAAVRPTFGVPRDGATRTG